MRLLLDTNALLWWFVQHPALSVKARAAIESSEHEVFVSAASAWELAIKTKSGKLQHYIRLDQLEDDLRDEGFRPVLISVEHALRAGMLPEHHKDPFDRMLVAQAQAEHLTLVSKDRIFERYGVPRIW